MSQGDNLVGVKTTYKGIEMRSKLESKVAMFLDALNIKWEYEPRLFMLSNGIPYKPDFYLSEQKIWIEVKGVIEEHNKKISELFVQENNTNLLLISPTKYIFFDHWLKDGEIYTDNDILVGNCSSCNKYFFCTNLGDYSCRICGFHDGDHDVKSSFGFFYGDEIDFSNIESIKRWLNGRKISI